MTKAMTLAATVVVAIGMQAGVGVAEMGTKPLAPPAESKAHAPIQEGMKKFDAGEWEGAHRHFTEAVKADSSCAEAYYNLALSLDKMGQPLEAAKQFKRAHDLGEHNPCIRDSAILQAHLKMLK